MANTFLSSSAYHTSQQQTSNCHPTRWPGTITFKTSPRCISGGGGDYHREDISQMYMRDYCLDNLFQIYILWEYCLADLFQMYILGGADYCLDDLFQMYILGRAIALMTSSRCTSWGDYCLDDLFQMYILGETIALMTSSRCTSQGGLLP